MIVSLLHDWTIDNYPFSDCKITSFLRNMEILPPLSVFCQLGFAKREDYYGAGSAMFPMPQAARKMEENLTKDVLRTCCVEMGLRH